MRTIIRDNYDPKVGDYYDRIVHDTVNNKIWLFDCDGVFLNASKTFVRVRDELGESETNAISQRAVTQALNELKDELFTSLADTDAKVDTVDEKVDELAKETSNQFTEVEEKIAGVEQKVDDVDSALSQEIQDREAADNNLQSQIDAISANSDVKDVVGTKADLLSYPTGTLGDNDIIKVLQDESESGATTYYRWTGTFQLIGSEGPYYTKSETDQKVEGAVAEVETKLDTTKSELEKEIESATAAKLGLDDILAGENISLDKADGKVTINAEGGGGGITTLTTADYNWNNTTHSAANPNSVAIWKLPAGIYIVEDTNLKVTVGTGYNNDSWPVDGSDMFIVSGDSKGEWSEGDKDIVVLGHANIRHEQVNRYGGTMSSLETLKPPRVFNLLTTSPNNVLSATVTAKLIYYDADQPNPAWKKIAIGQDTSIYPYWAKSNDVVAIGTGASIVDNGSTSVAQGLTDGSVALGAYSTATRAGEVNVGSSRTTHGYKNSNYRLISGVHDPEAANDAATKGYVDNLIAALEAKIEQLQGGN